MSDFSLHPTAAQLEATLRAYRMLDVPVFWADELIFPYYEGLSLRNIPHSIAALLGHPLPNSAPLLPEVWGAGGVPDVERVVLFLMDGLGHLHLNRLLESDPEIRDIIAELTEGRGSVPLTSVAPSTTAVALTSLWTGGTPGATGITGTLMYLREISMIGSMLKFSPVQGKLRGDIFADWGLPPESLVGLPGLSQHLAEGGIDTHLILDKYLAGSGLSRILHRGIPNERIAVHTSNSDMPLVLEHVLAQTRGQRCYVNVYWPAVDSIAHLHGAHGRHTHREILHRLRDLREVLAQDSVRDGKTLFIITADHGHYDIPNEINLMEDDDTAPIREALVLGGTGDNRLRNLYLREGHKERVQHYIAEQFADRMASLDAQAARAAGFYTAPQEREHPRLHERIGDVILLPRLGWIATDPSVLSFNVVSRHAGLSDWEMLIPLLWAYI